MIIFVDTSALYALLDADDDNHAPSAAAWQQIISNGQEPATSNYVLVEAFALIQSRLGLDAVREFQDALVPVLRIEFVTPEIHRLGVAALLTAARRRLSLVDCISFEIMREQKIRSVFAFDNHYRDAGFNVLP